MQSDNNDVDFFIAIRLLEYKQFFLVLCFTPVAQRIRILIDQNSRGKVSTVVET